MVVLDLDHPDIEEFISWKVNEEQKVADLVTGSIVCEKHLNAIMKAAHDEARAGNGASRSRAQSGAEDRDASSADDGHPAGQHAVRARFRASGLQRAR